MLTDAGLAARPGLELSLLLTDDAEMQRLNRAFRDQDKPTNVLSFPTEPAAHWRAPATQLPEEMPEQLGDVALGYQTVAREADQQGKPFADHLCHLVVHGVLHLLGHDHQTEPEAEEMERLEAKLLATLGIADPYLPQDRADGRSRPVA